MKIKAKPWLTKELLESVQQKANFLNNAVNNTDLIWFQKIKFT